jgi:hypothetical protein
MSTSNEERFHARAIINIIKEHDRIDVCNDDGGRHGRRGEEDGDDDDGRLSMSRRALRQRSDGATTSDDRSFQDLRWQWRSVSPMTLSNDKDGHIYEEQG